jgi:hypothetical protein
MKLEKASASMSLYEIVGGSRRRHSMPESPKYDTLLVLPRPRRVSFSLIFNQILTPKPKHPTPRRPSYNIDSVVDCLPPDPESCACMPAPHWSQVRHQFNHALDCATSNTHASHIIRQRQAFLALWTLHALDGRLTVCL